jgi:hypothetical protein
LFSSTFNFGRIDNYSHVARVLQPITPTIPSKDIVATVRQLHHLPSNHVPPFIFDFVLNHTFVLDRILFAQTLAIVHYLSSGGLFGMVYEHHSSSFILEDASLKFSKLFQTIAIVTCGDILRSVALMLGVSKLLAMVKDTECLCPIIVDEVFFQLISHSIVLQLWVSFQKHLSPHQFKILTLGGYETIIFGIKTFFNLHFDLGVMQIDIENTFKNIIQNFILKKLQGTRGLLAIIIPFTKLFYGVHFFLITSIGSMKTRSPILNQLQT